MRKRLPIHELAIVISLLSAHDLLAQSRNDELYCSIAKSCSRLVQTYLSSGGDPNASLHLPGSAVSISMLELAVRSGNDEIAQVLLQGGADPHNVAMGLSHSEFLAALVDKEMIRSLRQLLSTNPEALSGADPENHPLNHAVSRGNEELVTLILNALPESTDESIKGVLDESLLIALSSDSSSRAAIVRRLVDAGADAKPTVALAAAVNNCEPEVVEILLSAGSDPNGKYRDKSAGEYALACLDRSLSEPFSVLGLLKGAGVDVCDLDMASLNASSVSTVRQFGECRD